MTAVQQAHRFFGSPYTIYIIQYTLYIPTVLRDPLFQVSAVTDTPNFCSPRNSCPSSYHSVMCIIVAVII